MPAVTPPDVVEDVFEGQATGVEVEQDGDAEDGAIERPFKPEQIRVNTSNFALRNILDLIDDGSVELAPDFQRGRVWSIGQKSRLVESLLLQIPLPAFYFALDDQGAFRVVDGLQRLSTMHAFVRGSGNAGFALKGLEYLKEAQGKRYSELAVPWQRRINYTQLVVHVIDPTTPAGAMYEIFKRINTGGTPLNAQEIRHCMSRPRSRAILKEMTHTESFMLATNGLTDHIRMNDREMALRFTAFWLFSLEKYLAEPMMESFLMKATQHLDDPSEFPDARVSELLAAFDRAMNNAYLLFGEHAFRKWPQGASGRSPINRALFETWSVTLARYEPDDLIRRRTKIVTAVRRRMSTDVEYLDSITSSTSDRKRVKRRFDAAAADVRAGL